MIFKIFHENSHYRIKSEFIFAIFPQKLQFRIKNNSFEVSRNPTYIKLKCCWKHSNLLETKSVVCKECFETMFNNVIFLVNIIFKILTLCFCFHISLFSMKKFCFQCMFLTTHFNTYFMKTFFIQSFHRGHNYICRIHEVMRC